MKSFKPLLTAILASSVLFATSNAMAAHHSDKSKVDSVKTHMTHKTSHKKADKDKLELKKTEHKKTHHKKAMEEEKTMAKTHEAKTQNLDAKKHESKAEKAEMKKHEEKATKQASQKIAKDVNINTATAAELQASLIGIGEKKAQAIVDYRKEHGKFTKAEQLMDVKGIGESIFAKNKSHIDL